MALTLHATTVAIDGRGVLIRGASDSGKSALALQLMALGALLVADDRTNLTKGPPVIASCPAPLHGLIEARFVGLLHAQMSEPVPLALIVDLGQFETDRLPPARSEEILGQMLPLLHNVAAPYFPGAIMQYMIKGRRSP